VATNWREDIDRAAAQMAVLDKFGNPIFLPSVARSGPRLISEKPYEAMWQSVNSSYANFRYWSETLLATGLSPAYEHAMLRFRVERGGSLGGMSTYEDHLDDMPIEGYAYGQLRQDNISQFLLQLAGHAANYAARGTFGTTEQFSLYSTLDPRWRDYLPAKGQLATPRNPAELSLDFCEPSQMQMAMMSRWQLVMEEPDEPSLWIARGAPRRWYAPDGSLDDDEGLLFGIHRAPSRFGFVSAELQSVKCPATLHAKMDCVEAVQVLLSLEVPVPPSQPVDVYARVRSPHKNTTVVRAQLNGHHGGVEAVKALAARELVKVTLMPPVKRVKVLVELGPKPM
jgi:hypothetical protein